MRNLVTERCISYEPRSSFIWERFWKRLDVLRVTAATAQTTEERSAAAREIVQICRAAVAFFGTKKDYRSIQAVLDYFHLWAYLIRTTCPSVSIDLIRVPDEELESIEEAARAFLGGMAEDTKDDKILRLSAVGGRRGSGGELNLAGLHEYYKRIEPPSSE